MRPLSAALQTALVQPVVNVLYLVKIGFDSGLVAWNSGFKNISYNGDTYIGRGPLGSIGTAREQGGIKPAALSVTIGAIDPAVVSLLETEPYTNRKVWIYAALTDDAFIFDPTKTVLLFNGMIDSINCTMGKAATFELIVRSRLADWERARTLRYTDADQQKLHPGDKGFEFVAQLSQRRLIWPRAEFLPDPRD